MIRDRWLLGVLAVGALAVATLAAVPSAGAATTVPVTTELDTVAADGVTSLREAIDMANAATGPVTIVFDQPSTTVHQVGRCEAPEDANESGDLDLTSAQPVTIVGNANSTIIRGQCSAPNSARLVDHRGPGSLTLLNLTLQNANASLVSFEHHGLAVRSAGTLTLSNVRIEGNRAEMASGVAVEVSGTGSFTVTDSTFTNNDAAAVLDTGTGGPAVFSRSTVTDSRASFQDESGATAAGGITVTNRDATFSDVTVSNIVGANGAGSPLAIDRTGPDSAVVGGISVDNGYLLYGDRVRVTSNVGYAAGGIYGAVRLTNSSVTDNWGSFVGGIFTIEGRDSKIDGVEIRRNHSTTASGGYLGDGTISNSTIAENESTDPNRSTIGGGIIPNAALSIKNSTITGNRATTGGGIGMGNASGSIELDHVTLAGNVATGDDEGSEVSFGSPDLQPPQMDVSLRARATVFGDGGTRAPCAFRGVLARSCG
ncbi:MAG: right-handed parallel beta-helix repeat-containing protein [Actinobacteria bacterium]|nr:right-handed parallel beta-helix repeat-containing protein [Actinomycetota bacterium]